MKRRFLAISLLVLCASFLAFHQAGAQSFYTELYTERGGLPINSISDITQDRTGKLLIAGRNQLMRFDGQGWDQLTIVTNTGYVEHFPQRVHADLRNHYWVLGPNLRLMQYDQIQWTFMQMRSPMRRDRGWMVRSFAFLDRDNDVSLVGISDYALSLYDESGYRLAVTEDEMGRFNAYAVTDLDSCFLVGTEDGLRVLRDGNWEHHPILDIDLPEGGVHGLVTEQVLGDNGASGRKIWIISASWLASVDDSLQVDILHYPGFTLPEESYLAEPDGYGGLFFGCKDRLYWYQSNGQVSEFTNQANQTLGDFNNLYVDREHNLWVGQLDGLSKIPSFRFFNYNSGEGLLHDDVSCIEPWDDGKIVLGHIGGFTILSPDGIEQVPLKDLSGEFGRMTRVLDLERGSDGSIWAALDQQGIRELTPDGRLLKHMLPEEKLQAICLESIDEGLLVGTNYGLMIYDKEGSFRRVGRWDRNLYVRKLFHSKIHPERIYFVTTMSGLGILENEDLTYYQHSQVRLFNNIYTVYETSDGEVILGSGAGLLRFDGARIEPYRMNGEWISQPCFLVTESEGSLWVGTDRGLYRWDGKELKHYMLTEGIAGLETNRDAGYVDDEGRVWVGTTNGLSIYHPEYDLPLKPDHKPRIAELWADSVKIDLDSPQVKLSLDHSNALMIDYEFVSLRAENQVMFSQRLFNNRSDSLISERVTSDREALFLGLNPGDYRFDVRARIGEGPWSDADVLASILVPKRFLTEPMRSVLIVLGTLATLLLIFFVLRAIPATRDLFMIMPVTPSTGLDLLINTAGTVLYVDTGIVKWLRLSADRMVGRPLKELVENEDRDRISDMLHRQILDHKSMVQFEVRLLTGQEGKVRSVRITSQLVWENEHIIGQHITVLPRS